MLAAIQILEGETAHMTVERFMKAAMAQKVGFKTLEVMGIVPLGRLKLLRFKTDQSVTSVVQSFAPYRTIIYQEGASYVARVPEVGSVSKVNSLTMNCVAEPAVKRTYRGPGIKYWERQFL
jgi:hypothetical protein